MSESCSKRGKASESALSVKSIKCKLVNSGLVLCEEQRGWAGLLTVLQSRLSPRVCPGGFVSLLQLRVAAWHVEQRTRR